jgi:hypothetical protein
MRIERSNLQDKENIIGAISEIFLCMQALSQDYRDRSTVLLDHHLVKIEDHVLKLNLRLSQEKRKKSHSSRDA